MMMFKKPKTEPSREEKGVAMTVPDLRCFPKRERLPIRTRSIRRRLGKEGRTTAPVPIKQGNLEVLENNRDSAVNVRRKVLGLREPPGKIIRPDRIERVPPERPGDRLGPGPVLLLIIDAIVTDGSQRFIVVTSIVG